MERHHTGERRSPAAVVAAVPHLLILALMVFNFLSVDDSTRAFAGLYGFAEILVVPAGLIGALVLRFAGRRRSAGAVVLATAGGAVLVLLAAYVIGGVA